MPHTKNSAIRILGNRIQFGEDGLDVQFMRTLRIPDNGKTYPLPPALGTFPIKRVHDYLDTVPKEWREQGGVFLPMYQREAMWLNFSCPTWRPRALQVGVGKVCAVTGERWSGVLSHNDQNYMIVPKQPWLDGIANGNGTIRQFVAMPLGMGYTVEGQVTGEERFGGLQLQVFEPKEGRFPKTAPSPTSMRMRCAAASPCAPQACAAPSQAGASMGLAAGGAMKQKIYKDSYGVETWSQHQRSRIFVHLVNSRLWREITGEEAPSTPVTAQEYKSAGLPWYDVYDEGVASISGSETLAAVASVAQKDKEIFGHPLDDQESVGIDTVLSYAVQDPNGVYDGNW